MPYQLNRHILISIHPEHVRNILQGTKTVELRRANLHLEAGETLWIYTTAPDSIVEVVAKIGEVTRATPSQVWRQYGKSVRMDKAAFNSYADSRAHITAIKLLDVCKLDNPCTLADLRKASRKFHPPQGAIYITTQTPLLKVLERHYPSRWRTEADRGTSNC